MFDIRSGCFPPFIYNNQVDNHWSMTDNVPVHKNSSDNQPIYQQKNCTALLREKISTTKSKHENQSPDWEHQ